ncbi:sensor histidine kinase [Bacteroidota bacterium]
MTQKDDLQGFLEQSGKSDKMLAIVGIPLVSLIAIILFAFSLFQTELLEALVNVAMSLGITASIWIGCRHIILYLWKKYPWEEHPVKHITIEALSVILWAGLCLTFFAAIGYYVLKEKPDLEEVKVSLVFTFLITLLISSITEGWFFYTRWIKSRIISQNLEKEHLNAQFETLKSQVSPHFLFNSLNTLMSIVDSNEKAVSFVQNLSEFLRYGLQSKDNELVRVANEIKIIGKYIYLQKTRFKNNLNVNIKVDKEVQDNYHLPPMSLQMLVENAIKHNEASKENPLFIDIYNDGNESLIVKNNLQKKKVDDKTGLGLKNISQRYEYMSNKKVIIRQSDNVYMVSLPLLKLENN